ncbi:MAG: hypothetical protein N5P05_001201 [Chroococcopsis gigantea SAG 12.99]|jgi:hypothetical protein|nr:hypothetical protein [Chlorogloea purpurea SAG 13.99]MDV2999595.1 hypothetical protein [Chroococcopsis gigantea SAG 12.99]
MKNILTLLALLISVSGIGVSLAREEVRCLLGLESSCSAGKLPEKEIAPAEKATNPQPETTKVKSTTYEPKKALKEETSQPETVIKEDIPVSTKQEDKTNELKAIPEPNSQPLEVIPPPDGGQPLEVTSPPQN